MQYTELIVVRKKIYGKNKLSTFSWKKISGNQIFCFTGGGIVLRITGGGIVLLVVVGLGGGIKFYYNKVIISTSKRVLKSIYIKDNFTKK